MATAGSPAPGAGGATRSATHRVPIAETTDYAEAQRIVDVLSDRGFPVEHVAIIGRDLALVEVVTGRLTTARAALMGAGSGAWIGLLFGLLVSLFTDDRSWLGLVLGGLILGALWGAVLAAVAHLATGGRRDFSSMSGLVPARFTVEVDADHAAAALQVAGLTATDHG